MSGKTDTQKGAEKTADQAKGYVQAATDTVKDTANAAYDQAAQAVKSTQEVAGQAYEVCTLPRAAILDVARL